MVTKQLRNFGGALGGLLRLVRSSEPDFNEEMSRHVS